MYLVSKEKLTSSTKPSYKPTIQQQLQIVVRQLEGLECHPQNPRSNDNLPAKGCVTALERLERMMDRAAKMRSSDLTCLALAVNALIKTSRSVMGGTPQKPHIIVERALALSKEIKGLKKNKRNISQPSQPKNHYVAYMFS